MEDKLIVTTYRDELPGGQIRVVVQALLPRLFGLYNRVAADGFVVSPEGVFSEVPEEMLWEFA